MVAEEGSLQWVAVGVVETAITRKADKVQLNSRLPIIVRAGK